MTCKSIHTPILLRNSKPGKKPGEWLKDVYLATQNFPKTEQFGLTAQLRRSALAVASNLAEGSGRKTPADKAHYTTIAYSSLLEALNQIIIAADLGYISKENYGVLRSKAERVSYKMNNLRNSQLEEAQP